MGRVSTVLLAHGAWANASCWSRVILLIEKAGIAAIAVQMPLTALEDNVAAVRRAIALEPGPVLLAGHSYERLDGSVVAEVQNPRCRYEQARAVPWDELHRAFFSGYALWTYLTTPFLLDLPGVMVSEQEPWREDGQRWRVLWARFPASLVTHSAVQDFFFDEDLLLHRYDTFLGSAGDFHWAQLVSAHPEADDVWLPSRRRAYRRGPDHRPVSAPVMVSFDLADVRFTPAPNESRPPRGRNGAKP